MAVSIVQHTGISAYQGNSTTVVSGTSTGYQRTLTVTAGSTLVARIGIRNVGQTGALISAITDSKGQTWTKREEQQDTAEDSHGWSYIFDCQNAAAGSTTISLDCAVEDNNNFIVWMVTELAGVPTSSAHDKGNKTSVSGTASSISVPATAALAQADSIYLVLVSAKWWYDINGGSAPTNWTLDGYANANSFVCAMFASRIVTSTTGLGFSVTGVANQSTDDGATGIIYAYKAAGSSNYRVRALFDTTINGDSSITAYVWTGEPSSVVATKFTGLTAEASGGVLLINLPSTGYTNGQSVNVLAFNSTDTSGLITATVETY